ncbi:MULTISPECIES: hypothetical protein [unclassified Sphingomonas]|uniref:hypothetical protein n=1 Tax=unclassified Sphingomonas TaxID=196159 RepID=UPI00226A04E9|nr:MULTISPECIES: hypothetical protein [unclassified Sphingomonas]
MFVPLDQVTATSLRTSKDGLFCAGKPTPAGARMLIITDQDGRFAVLLDEGPQRFHFYPIEQSWGRITGTTFQNARIEVDHSSSFDPERGEALGDLVIVGSMAAIVAVNGSSSWADPMRFFLAERDTTRGGEAVGFHRWRYVVGSEAAPTVVWERTPEPARAARAPNG